MVKDMSRFPSQMKKQFLTRFPDGMRERIAEEATKNHRTMNEEIIIRLTWSFTDKFEFAEFDKRASALSIAAQRRLLSMDLGVGRQGTESEAQTPSDNEDALTKRLADLEKRVKELEAWKANVR